MLQRLATGMLIVIAVCVCGVGWPSRCAGADWFAVAFSVGCGTGHTFRWAKNHTVLNSLMLDATIAEAFVDGGPGIAFGLGSMHFTYGSGMCIDMSYPVELNWSIPLSRSKQSVRIWKLVGSEPVGEDYCVDYFLGEQSGKSVRPVNLKVFARSNLGQPDMDAELGISILRRSTEMGVGPKVGMDIEWGYKVVIPERGRGHSVLFMHASVSGVVF